ncbi:MAG TPA: D-2-hydroxyacid dehydrogenase family protein [Alphaproteobacteria bacterium]|nr:D-2-hydroxyacid dehydrogenase family protein [Alphaproteobacteria bacterium]
MTTHLAILDDYQGVALELADWASLGPEVSVISIREVLPNIEAAARRLSNFEILVAMRERTPFPKALIERLPKLKLLVTTGMRNASIDAKTALDRGIAVCGTEMLSHPTAELTWGLLLSLARGIPREARNMSEGRWQTTVGVGLRGKTLGLLGLGRLGGEVAKIGKAFGMELIAWSGNLTAERAAAAGAEFVAKNELFRRADFVTIHLVLSERTKGLVGASELSAMKPTAFLVNTSRGPIVDTPALIAALELKRIAGAAIDVYDTEPLPADHPLRRLENALLTPHIGYVIAENYRLAYGQAVENVRGFLAGKPLRMLKV